MKPSILASLKIGDVFLYKGVIYMAGTPCGDKNKRRVFCRNGALYIDDRETVFLIDIQTGEGPPVAPQLVIEGTIEAINEYARQYRALGFSVEYGSMCTDINIVGDNKRIWITVVVKLTKDT